ncbi:hypothetical protein C0992_005875 [Termitomyces sp. T32_za158]|nr:hypothetical protein C0992_005875 [Termitomyces sp. T32_za158]
MIYSPRPAAIEDYVFVQLAQRLKDKPLLPCLHSLSYPISAEIFLFITPSLRRVNIAKSPGRDNGPFLVALLGTTPLLEEYSGWTFSASFSTVLSKFAQLRVIDVGNQKVGNPNSLHRIFLVPLLTELRVCLAEFEPSTELADNLDAPFLRTLTLEGHPGSIRTLLTRLGSTPLVALRVEYGDEEEEPWEAQWCTRLNLIAIWSSSLETLELYDNGSDTQGTLTPSIMDQLLKMTRLKHVKLNFRPILKFDDVYMTKIARAWTRLKLLDIRFSRRVTQPLMTIVSLEAFATHCPQLHSLSLHINLQPSKLAPSPRCILCHGLQRLFIQHPVTGDAALVARHLLALFPCLQNVRSDHGDPANQDVWEGWNDVQDMIQLCRVTAEDNKMRQKKLWQSCC